MAESKASWKECLYKCHIPPRVLRAAAERKDQLMLIAVLFLSLDVWLPIPTSLSSCLVLALSRSAVYAYGKGVGGAVSLCLL